MSEKRDPQKQICHELEGLNCGQLIRRARELLGLTQEGLANEIGVVKNTVARWERDVQKVRPYYQQRLAELFGLEVRELGYLQEPTVLAQVPESEFPWNVPFSRNPYFTGYDEVIENLHQRLSAEKNGVAIEAISGMGGIGKTQLMLEYAYRKRGGYQAVFWLRADRQEQLEEDIAQAAKVLGVSEARKRRPNHQYLVNEVKQWLRKHPGWLLLLDNVEEDVKVKDLLMGMQRGHVLLTTRSQAVAGLASNLHLDKMQPEEGALLLLRRAQVLPPGASLDTLAEAHRREALELSLLLDGLPLALDQAGAYIEENKCSLSDYIQLYYKCRKELLQRRGQYEKLYTDYKEPVATTWSISFNWVEQQCPAATQLMNLCAYLYPDAIPVDILLEAFFPTTGETNPIVEDVLHLNQACEIMLRYSLIRRNANRNLISLHRLVQAVLQDGMDESTKRLWVEQTVRSVEKAFSSAPCERIEHYIPQARVCADLIEQWNLVGDEATLLLERVAREVYKRGWYLQALALFQSAHRASNASRGSDDLRTIQLLSELGRVYIELGGYRMAIDLYVQARKDFERLLGVDHPAVVDCLNNQALAAMRGKYLTMATQFCGRACAWYAGLSEPIYAAEKAMTYYITAEIAAQLGPEGAVHAEDYFLDAHDIAIQAWGRGSAKFADIIGGLGRFYTRYRKFEQAEHLLRQALEIRRSIYGHDHPQVADSLGDLAELAHCQGDLVTAEQFYEQALAIRLEKLGLYHPEISHSYRALAVLAWHQGKSNEAEQLYRYAFTFYQWERGTETPAYLSLLGEWADFLRDRGRVKEADACEQEVTTTTRLIEKRGEILSNLIPKDEPDPIVCFLRSLAFRQTRAVGDRARRTDLL